MSYPSNSDSVANDQLRAFVERIERLEEERKAIAGDIAEVYAEAKGNGYDRAALKAVVRIRAQDPNERLEREAIIALYLNALGMASEEPSHVHVHPRVEIIEEIPPHDADGVILETIPGNGAEAAEEEVEVASVAPSSAQPIEQGAPEGEHSPRADVGLAGPAWTADAQPADTKPALIPIATSGFPPSAGANDDRGGAVSSPVSASVITNADRSKPHPFCKDPEDCGVEASWKYMCGSCHRTMEKALRDGAAA